MLHQVIFYKVFILSLRLKIIRSLCKLFYIPVAESASFPHQAKRVKTNLCITVYETLTCHVECFSFYKHSLLILQCSTWEKSYEHIYHSPPHVSVMFGNILITIIRFARNRLFTSNSTLVTDPQSWRNLNEHHHYFTSTKSPICQTDGNCSPFQLLNLFPFHIRLEGFKLTHYSLLGILSRCNFPS